MDRRKDGGRQAGRLAGRTGCGPLRVPRAGTSPHLDTQELRRVADAGRQLSLRAAVVPLGLFDLNQLLVQSLLLKQQLLGLPRLHAEFLLQGQDHTILPFDLIHLKKRRNSRPSQGLVPGRLSAAG